MNKEKQREKQTKKERKLVLPEVTAEENLTGEHRSFVQFRNVSRIFTMGTNEIRAVDDVTFGINEGEFCVIVGQSGAGKTTLLNMLGGMDRVTEGEIYVGNLRVSDFNERQLTLYRRHSVGFVFQFYNLIQNLTAVENVEIASELCENPLDAMQTLIDVGLEARAQNFPAQLSGGEQQRVAIARAVAKNPQILLCDEPTGALDYETGKKVLKLLHNLCREMKKTVIVITHNSAITQMADRVVHMKNGKILSCEENASPVDVEALEW